MFKETFFSIKSIENIREKLERMAYENIYPSVFKIKKNVTAFANKTNIKIFDPFDFMCDLNNKRCDFLTDNGEKKYIMIMAILL